MCLVTITMTMSERTGSMVISGSPKSGTSFNQRWLETKFMPCIISFLSAVIYCALTKLLSRQI